MTNKEIIFESALSEALSELDEYTLDEKRLLRDFAWQVFDRMEYYETND